MNLSDLEQRMKADFDEIDFSPKDQEWDRMQDALKPRRSALLLLLPFHKAVAAAALVVGLGTTGLYLFFSRTEKEGIALAPTPAKQTPAAPHSMRKIHKPEADEQPPYTPFTGINQQVMASAQAPATPVINSKEQVEETPNPIIKEDPGTTKQEQPLTAYNHDSTSKKPFNRAIDPSPYHYPATGNANHSLRLGLAANVGKPSLGNVQYNVGVVARKNLSERFYAEANVSLSSSNVHYSEKGPNPPSPGIPSDGLSVVREAMDLNFVNNIISVGVAPSIGFKVASNLSVAAGGDIYRAINRNLKPQFTEAEYNYNVKSQFSDPIPQRNITNWDFGLKAQVEYKINRSFSLSTQYRQGLTQYILIDGKSVKNSNFTIGLKYYFLKVH